MLLVAVVMIWAGVGSILARRWVRAVMLIIAWTWLLTGIVTMIFLALGWDAMVGAMEAQIQLQAQTSGAPPPAISVVALVVIVVVFMALIYVVVPGLFVWAYTSCDVQRTCEAKHPQPAWTERCPLPVLGVSVAFVITAVLLVPALLYNVVPFFGTIVTGWPAALVYLLAAAVMLILARETYRLTLLGWWGATLLLILAPLSIIITLLRHDVIDLYRAMGLPDDQLMLMEQYQTVSTTTMQWFLIVLTVLCVGYMVYIYRYFSARSR